MGAYAPNLNIAEWCNGSTLGFYPRDTCSNQVSATNKNLGGIPKKFNVKRIIKVASCFAVIAIVLITTGTFPSLAVNNILNVWDYEIEHYEENGVLYYSFSFQDIPSYYTLADSSSHFAEGYPPISISGTPSTDWIQVHAWPLGVRNWGGANCSGGVIAVSDFERFISVDLSCSGSLVFLYNGTTSGDPYTFFVRSYWHIYYYDADGKYLGRDESETVENTVTYYAPVTDVPVSALGTTMELNMPENTAYFCPMLKAQLYLPDQGSDFVYTVKSSFDGFTLGCSASSVMQNTETLMRIEEQLGTLNDKADTVINGTPEMNEEALNRKQDLWEQQNKIHQNQQMEQEYMDAWEESTDDLNNAFTSFLNGKGYTQLSALVAPIMNWEQAGIIMLLAVCFINMSVLFFGR